MINKFLKKRNHPTKSNKSQYHDEISNVLIDSGINKHDNIKARRAGRINEDYTSISASANGDVKDSDARGVPASEDAMEQSTKSNQF